MEPNEIEIKHQFFQEDFFFPNWEIDLLVLGTFNPSCGEKTDYYYGRCRNNFWRTIESINKLDYMSLQNNFSRKSNLMRTLKFGCVDVIKSICFIPEKFKKEICGSGYSDQLLFSKSKVKLNYQFDEIKDFIDKKKVSKVINTWGKRDAPKFFRNEIIRLINYCNENGIEYIKECPSPSGRLRGEQNLNNLERFYKKHIGEIK